MAAPTFSALRQPRVTSAEVLRVLLRAHFRVLRQSGSHIRLRSADGSHSVTIPLHSGQILKPKTLAAILDEAGLSVERLRDLL
jgi:predicted RNA binding protein YcfA (HicA-like mRNA interferase family)